MNCPSCHKQIDDTATFCPNCGTEIDTSSTSNSGSIIDSVVKGENIHLGDKHEHKYEAPDLSKPKSATYTGKLCPICHRLAKDDWFQCPECKKMYICTKHQDGKTSKCIDCVKRFSDHVARGSEYLKRRKFDLALKEFGLAHEINESDDELRSLTSKAESLLEKISRLTNEGKVAYENGDYEVAEEPLRKALELDPESSWLNQTIASMQDKIRESEQREIEQESRQLLSRATGLYNKEKYESADGLLNRVLELSPDSVDAKKLSDRISTLLFEQKATEKLKCAREAFEGGNLEIARGLAAEAVNSTPRNADAKQLSSEINKALNVSSKKRNRSLQISAVALVVFAMIAVVIINWYRANEEEETYMYAQEFRQPNVYLQKYPSGEFVREMRLLEDTISYATEDSVYATARNRGEPSEYLSSYPSGRYVLEMNQLVSSHDAEAYAAARLINTRRAYENYLATYTNGAHVAEAQAAVDAFVSPLSVSNYRANFDLSHIVVMGRYAWLFETGFGGIPQIIDIINPSSPKDTGIRTAWAKSVAVVGKNAFLAGPPGLMIWEISDYNSNREVSMYRTKFGQGSDIAVIGNYAYEIDNLGLWVFDIDDITSPKLVGSCESFSGGVRLDISGNHAYVCTSKGDLWIVDISDPSSPRAVSQFNDRLSRAWQVVVAGDNAFVAGDYNGLRIVDISNSLAPKTVGSFDPPGRVSGVAVTENYIFLASGKAGLWILDIRNPSSPEEIGKFTDEVVLGVELVGNYAYLACGKGGMKILDVSVYR